MWAEYVAQLIECFPTMQEIVNLTPCTILKRKNSHGVLACNTSLRLETVGLEVQSYSCLHSELAASLPKMHMHIHLGKC